MRAPASLVVVLSLLAGGALGASPAGCDDGGGRPDAGADAARPRDAGAADAAPGDADSRACAQVGDCPCFTNYDCPPTHACVSQDPQGMSVSCVPGPRGTGAAGTPCAGEGDCQSALCVDDASGGRRCSDLCGPGLPACPATLPRCLGALGICAR